MVLIQHRGFFIGTETRSLTGVHTYKRVKFDQFIKFSHIPSLNIVESLNFVELLYDGAMERKQMFSAFFVLKTSSSY